MNFEFDDNISQGYCSDVPQVSPDSFSYSFNSNNSYHDVSIEFIEQPADYRYRYLKEKYHGHIVGESSPATKKKDLCKFPKLKLHNYSESAVVRVWLITTELDKPKAHFHKLARKPPKEILSLEPHDFIAAENNNYEVTLDYMHIVHAVTNDDNDINIYCKKKAHIESRAYEPPPKTPPSSKVEKDEIKHIDKNQSVLFIQVFDKKTGHFLCEAISRKIKNLHNAETGALKIVNCSRTFGSCRGNDEVFIFVEKISKDVEVRFFKLGTDKKREWEALAQFGPQNVHHQLGIIFRTPKFNQNISEDTQVFFELHRKSDGAVSKPLPFIYKPQDNYISLKRPHTEIISEDENLPSVIATYCSKRMKDESMSPDSTTISVKNHEVSHEVIGLENCFGDFDYNSANLLNCEPNDLSDLNIILDPYGCGTEIVGDFDEEILIQNTLSFDGTSLSGVAESAGIERKKNIIDFRSPCHDEYLEDSSEEKVTPKPTSKNISRKYSEQESLIPAILQRRKLHEIQQILKRTVNINAVDFEGSSALHYAAEYYSECLKLLLEIDDIDRNLRNLSGDNILLHAVRCQNSESVKILLQKNYEPNIHNIRSGETPLHLAVSYENIQLVELLFKNGANPLIDNHSDLSAYEYSLNCGEEIKRLVRLNMQKKLFRGKEFRSEGSDSNQHPTFENVLVGKLNELVVSTTT